MESLQNLQPKTFAPSRPSLGQRRSLQPSRCRSWRQRAVAALLPSRTDTEALGLLGSFLAFEGGGGQSKESLHTPWDLLGRSGPVDLLRVFVFV